MSSCQKHSLPPTHGRQRETEGARVSTGLTEIQKHTHRKKEAVGHLRVGPLLFCSCAGVSKRSSVPSGLQKPQSEITGFSLHLVVQGMSQGWGDVKVSLASD